MIAVGKGPKNKSSGWPVTQPTSTCEGRCIFTSCCVICGGYLWRVYVEVERLAAEPDQPIRVEVGECVCVCVYVCACGTRHERDDKERDLGGRAEGDAEGEVHLLPEVQGDQVGGVSLV